MTSHTNDERGKKLKFTSLFRKAPNHGHKTHEPASADQSDNDNNAEVKRNNQKKNQNGATEPLPPSSNMSAYTNASFDNASASDSLIYEEMLNEDGDDFFPPGYDTAVPSSQRTPVRQSKTDTLHVTSTTTTGTGTGTGNTTNSTDDYAYARRKSSRRDIWRQMVQTVMDGVVGSGGSGKQLQEHAVIREDYEHDHFNIMPQPSHTHHVDLNAHLASTDIYGDDEKRSPAHLRMSQYQHIVRNLRLFRHNGYHIERRFSSHEAWHSRYDTKCCRRSNRPRSKSDPSLLPHTQRWYRKLESEYRPGSMNIFMMKSDKKEKDEQQRTYPTRSHRDSQLFRYIFDDSDFSDESFLDASEDDIDSLIRTYDFEVPTVADECKHGADDDDDDGTTPPAVLTSSTPNKFLKWKSLPSQIEQKMSRMKLSMGGGDSSLPSKPYGGHVEASPSFIEHEFGGVHSIQSFAVKKRDKLGRDKQRVAVLDLSLQVLRIKDTHGKTHKEHIVSSVSRTSLVGAQCVIEFHDNRDYVLTFEDTAACREFQRLLEKLRKFNLKILTTQQAPVSANAAAASVEPSMTRNISMTPTVSMNPAKRAAIPRFRPYLSQNAVHDVVSPTSPTQSAVSPKSTVQELDLQLDTAEYGADGYFDDDDENEQSPTASMMTMSKQPQQTLTTTATTTATGTRNIRFETAIFEAGKDGNVYTGTSASNVVYRIVKINKWGTKKTRTMIIHKADRSVRLFDDKRRCHSEYPLKIMATLDIMNSTTVEVVFCLNQKPTLFVFRSLVDLWDFVEQIRTIAPVIMVNDRRLRNKNKTLAVKSKSKAKLLNGHTQSSKPATSNGHGHTNGHAHAAPFNDHDSDDIDDDDFDRDTDGDEDDDDEDDGLARIAVDDDDDAADAEHKQHFAFDEDVDVNPNVLRYSVLRLIRSQARKNQEVTWRQHRRTIYLDLEQRTIRMLTLGMHIKDYCFDDVLLLEKSYSNVNQLHMTCRQLNKVKAYWYEFVSPQARAEFVGRILRAMGDSSKQQVHAIANHDDDDVMTTTVAIDTIDEKTTVDTGTAQSMPMLQSQPHPQQTINKKNKRRKRLSSAALRTLYDDEQKDGDPDGAAAKHDLEVHVTEEHRWSYAGANKVAVNDDVLSMIVASWNVSESELNFANLSMWIPPSRVEPHDLYVIGLQECAPALRKQWLSGILRHIDCGRGQYVPLHKTWLLGIGIIIIVHRSHVCKISHLDAQVVATGKGNIIGNKGATAISFQFQETSFIFINAHLAAKAEKFEKRAKNFNRIIKLLELGRSGLDVLHQFTHTFFLGDLNYRVKREFFEAVNLVKMKKWSDLLLTDQLCEQMKSNAVFYGFKEGEINFCPTYRWERSANIISNKKGQPPSYCDRILYKSLPQTFDLWQECYLSSHRCFGSDHRPIWSLFKFKPKMPYFSTNKNDFSKSVDNVTIQLLELRAVFNFNLKSVKSEKDAKRLHFDDEIDAILYYNYMAKPIGLKHGKYDGRHNVWRWPLEILDALRIRPFIADPEFIASTHIFVCFRNVAKKNAVIGYSVVSLFNAFPQSLVDTTRLCTEYGTMSKQMSLMPHTREDDFAANGSAMQSTQFNVPILLYGNRVGHLKGFVHADGSLLDEYRKKDTVDLLASHQNGNVSSSRKQNFLQKASARFKK